MLRVEIRKTRSRISEGGEICMPYAVIKVQTLNGSWNAIALVRFVSATTKPDSPEGCDGNAWQ